MATTRTEIIARLQIEGFHRWPAAPREVQFLSFRHRHLFHVEARFPVTHDDRQKEFVLVKREISAALTGRFGVPCEFGSRSCEAIARLLLRLFPEASTMAVFEDGENGASVTR